MNTYNANEIQIDMNEIRKIDSEISRIWNKELL